MYACEYVCFLRLSDKICVNFNIHTHIHTIFIFIIIIINVPQFNKNQRLDDPICLLYFHF